MSAVKDDVYLCSTVSEDSTSATLDRVPDSYGCLTLGKSITITNPPGEKLFYQMGKTYILKVEELS